MTFIGNVFDSYYNMIKIIKGKKDPFIANGMKNVVVHTSKTPFDELKQDETVEILSRKKGP